MRRVSGRQLLIAAAFSVVTTLVAVALSAATDYFRKDWHNPLGVIAVVGLASLSGIIPLFKSDPVKSHPAPAGGPSQGPAAAPAARKQPVPLLLAAVLVLAICGGGAAATVFGVQYAGGLITGHESGPDILVEPAQGNNGDLELTVEHVYLTAHFTRVAMTARNTGSFPVTIPVFRNCFLNPAGSDTLTGDTNRSDWPETVAAGGRVSGTVVFKRIATDVTSANLSFAVVYGPGGGSIAVDMSLNAA